MTDVKGALENILNKRGLSVEEKETLIRIIGRLKKQEQFFLLQIFQNFPDKIMPFLKITKDKFAYFKDKQGNTNEILKEEIELFS